MITLFTATSVDSEEKIGHISSIISRGVDKYGDEFFVALPDLPTHRKIAEIAARVGAQIQLFIHNIDNLDEWAMMTQLSISIYNGDRSSFIDNLFSSVDNIVAFDDNDPVLLAGMKAGKKYAVIKIPKGDE